MKKWWEVWPSGRRSAPPPPDEPLLDVPPLPTEDLIRRGDQASRLLRDEVLAGAFAEIRQDAYRMWLDSKPSDTLRREELYRIVQALELVRGKLRAYRGAGLMKQAERQQEEAAETVEAL
jgi:hypothetical protein